MAVALHERVNRMITKIRIEASGLSRQEVTESLDMVREACLKALPDKVENIFAPIMDGDDGWYEVQQEVVELKAGVDGDERNPDIWRGRIVIGVDHG